MQDRYSSRTRGDSEVNGGVDNALKVLSCRVLSSPFSYHLAKRLLTSAAGVRIYERRPVLPNHLTVRSIVSQ